MDLVARRLDRAGAHPAPHQDDVLVRGVVEAMPAAARRIDHVAFARRLLALVGVDVAVPLEHDEELVAIAMAAIFVPGARFQRGPAGRTIRARAVLLDR